MRGQRCEFEHFSRDGQKWMDFNYILEVETREFGDQLNEVMEKNEELAPLP